MCVVEFKDSLGLFLSEGFEQDSYSNKLVFESVQSARNRGREWETVEYHRVILDGTVCSAAGRSKLSERVIGAVSAQFSPLVLFISRAEFVRVENMLQRGSPEKVVDFAREQVARIPKLNPKFDSLLARHRSRRLRPLKETIRIALPPRPASRVTVRLELPPSPEPPPE